MDSSELAARTWSECQIDCAYGERGASHGLCTRLRLKGLLGDPELVLVGDLASVSADKEQRGGRDMQKRG